MSFRALLVTRDDQAVEILAPVLSDFGLMVHCCGYPDAVCLVSEQKFQAVLVDFDDPHSAALILQNAANASFENHAITVGLLNDRSKVRSAFGVGANFVLYKPIAAVQAEATLRAATALIKRERRNSFRVPVQVPVKLRLVRDSFHWDARKPARFVARVAAGPCYPASSGRTGIGGGLRAY